MCILLLCVFCRDLSTVLGFSRETLVALVTNIDRREWQRRKCVINKEPLEHPRASTTDDVKCFSAWCVIVLVKILPSRKWSLWWRKLFVNFQSGLILHSLFSTTLLHTTDITRALILNLISHLRRLKTSVFLGENSHLHLLDDELPYS